MNRITAFALSLCALLSHVDGWAVPSQVSRPCSWQPKCSHDKVRRDRVLTSIRMVVGEETEKKTAGKTGAEVGLNAEETTEKYGLEAGLFKSFQQKDGGATAQSLLKKYGIAYLATSIPLAIVSFVVCYIMVDVGVDVASLLAKVGIDAGEAGEKAGTAAIAYAAHKAASPLRFPPTVILTPFVAKLIGKQVEEDRDIKQDQD